MWFWLRTGVYVMMGIVMVLTLTAKYFAVSMAFAELVFLNISHLIFVVGSIALVSALIRLVAETRRSKHPATREPGTETSEWRFESRQEMIDTSLVLNLFAVAFTFLSAISRILWGDITPSF